jgi:hypothetical protein
MKISILEGIGSSLTVGVTGLVLGWLLRSVRREARLDSGKHVLEYGTAMRWSAAFFAVICVGLAVTSLFVPFDVRIEVMLMAVFFTALTLPLLLEFFRVRIVFDDESIHCFSPWRSSRCIPWLAVTARHFSRAAQWHVIETTGYGRIRLHIYLSGIQTFLETMDKKMANSAQPTA